MSRDPWKLKVFVLADELVVEAYRATAGFPIEERFGLQSQIRRSAASIPTNLVEGCARRTLPDYRRFVDVALSSASEIRYLLGLGMRLGFLATDELSVRYDGLVRGLQVLLSSLESPPSGT